MICLIHLHHDHHAADLLGRGIIEPCPENIQEGYGPGLGGALEDSIGQGDHEESGKAWRL